MLAKLVRCHQISETVRVMGTCKTCHICYRNSVLLRKQVVHWSVKRLFICAVFSAVSLIGNVLVIVVIVAVVFLEVYPGFQAV